MDLWKLGFALLMVGIGIPIAYGLYSFVLASISWYWRLSIISIILGCVMLLIAPVKDRMDSETPEEKY